MGKVKVKAVFEKLQKQPAEPIIIRFEHADVNISHRGSNGGGIDLSDCFAASVYKNDSFERSRGLGLRVPVANTTGNQVVTLQSDRMTYIGSTDNQFSRATESLTNASEMRTFIAIRRKKKMKIYEATQVTLSPYLKGHSFVKEVDKDTDIKLTTLEKKAAGVDLVKAFGSKKKRLTLERREKHQTDTLDMSESISAAVESIEAPNMDLLEAKDETILELIPPCDRLAATAQDVYKLNDILNASDMSDMDDLAEQFLNLSHEDIKTWKEGKKFSEYFFTMWRKLSLRKNDPKSSQRAKLVLYTELLICMLKLRYDQLRKKELPLPSEFPLWLVEKALDNFTTVNASGARNRSDASKDKTCCYIMVSVLLANDLEFDVQLMSVSLQIHIKKLLTLARAVGITITYNSSSKEYRGILKLPLPKAIEKRGRMRRTR